MNTIFKAYLRKFVLVFYEDILVCSKSLSDNMSHLRLVFDILLQHQLYGKQSKCSFGCAKIENLGHLISQNGVQADSKKIDVMLD